MLIFFSVLRTKCECLVTEHNSCSVTEHNSCLVAKHNFCLVTELDNVNIQVYTVSVKLEGRNDRCLHLQIMKD
jgi:hypothetical protein